VFFAFGSKTEKALETEGKRFGFKYFSEGNRFTVADHPDLDPLIQAGGRAQIRNLLEGEHRGEPIQLFEIRYRMPRVGLGKRETRLFSAAKILLPIPSRCIKIHTEPGFNELLPIAGFQDLVLPAGPGQEVLFIRVEDIAYAHRVLDKEMRAFTSRNVGISLEINHGALFVYLKGALTPETIGRTSKLAHEAFCLVQPVRRTPHSTLTPGSRLL